MPYAMQDHAAYTAKVQEAFAKIGEERYSYQKDNQHILMLFYSAGIEVESIHSSKNQLETVKTAQAFFVGGGNTFLLLKTLIELSLINPIRERVLQVPSDPGFLRFVPHLKKI